MLYLGCLHTLFSRIASRVRYGPLLLAAKWGTFTLTFPFRDQMRIEECFGHIHYGMVQLYTHIFSTRVWREWEKMREYYSSYSSTKSRNHTPHSHVLENPLVIVWYWPNSRFPPHGNITHTPPKLITTCTLPDLRFLSRIPNRNGCRTIWPDSVALIALIGCCSEVGISVYFP